MIKSVLHMFLGTKNYGRVVGLKSFVYNFISLLTNGFVDILLYFRHSTVFYVNTFNKVEAKIILHYHAIEKGFLHDKFKFRFGENRVQELIILLKKPIVKSNSQRTQIAAAYLSICKYYEIHDLNNIDISDYYDRSEYGIFKKLVRINDDIVKNHAREDYFKYRQCDFERFSKSRVSIRNFSGERIPFNIIEKVIELSLSAPSVCNRQPNKIYYVDCKNKIENIFSIQQGLKGYSEGINQLLVLVSDRNYFYTVGERSQMFIDGGMFLMNLLYSLHYYGICACPAHWGLKYSHDVRIRNELGIAKSEKVICLIPIGMPKDRFLSTLSLRRKKEEVLFHVQS